MTDWNKRRNSICGDLILPQHKLGFKQRRTERESRFAFLKCKKLIINNPKQNKNTES
jgi:hypothetical protein